MNIEQQMKILEYHICKLFPASPIWANRDLIMITFGHQFEPFGRASETWESVWSVELPYVHAMYRLSDNIWRKTESDIPAMFFGKELSTALNLAVRFMIEAKPEAK